MEIKVVRPRVKEIQERFFNAIDILIAEKRIKSLQSFCADYELHRPKYSNIRTFSRNHKKPGTGYKFIDIDAVSYLVVDYGVSSEWIMAGRGDMFKTKKAYMQSSN